jgi:TonB family protein
MINRSRQRAYIAILSTLCFHTSLAYAIYEIESTVIAKEAISHNTYLVLIDYVSTKEISIKKEIPQKQIQTVMPKRSEKKEVPKRIKQEVQPIHTKKPIQNEVKKEFVHKTEEINTQEQEMTTASATIRKNNDVVIEDKNIQKEQSNRNEINQYLSKIRTRIQTNIMYPSLAKQRQLQGESIVEFTLLKSGHIDEASIQIKQSSGHSSLDKQAIKTLLDVSPFGIPPKHPMTIVLPVIFQLN